MSKVLRIVRRMPFYGGPSCEAAIQMLLEVNWLEYGERQWEKRAHMEMGNLLSSNVKRIVSAAYSKSGILRLNAIRSHSLHGPHA